MKSGRLCLALVMALAVAVFPAQAATVSIGLSMSYFNTIPGNPVTPQPPPVVPSNFVGTQLKGTANFFAGLSDPIFGSPDIGALNVGDIFTTTIHPTNACLGDGSCTLKFSFGSLVGTIPVMAFVAIPVEPIAPSVAPSILIGALDFLQPTPPPIRVAGLIIGFDDPEVVGEWAVTLSVDNTPLPAALPLFASGLGALGLFGGRRKRKQIAA